MININKLADIPDNSAWRTRFAPSPTGYLHAGHAYAALVVWHIAGRNPETFLLRIDDLDYTRSTPDFTKQIKADLNWLGISWHAPEIYQSQRLERYKDALYGLESRGLIYPCYLSRSEISSLIIPSQNSSIKQPHTRNILSAVEIAARQSRGIHPVLRLDMEQACAQAGDLYWQDLNGQSHLAQAQRFGDIIIGRRDITASYHLSVVLDDADSDIQVVTRGGDLQASTDIHRLLQYLLGLPVPLYFHHELIMDDTGQKLSKRNKSKSILSMRESGLSIKNIINSFSNDTRF